VILLIALVAIAGAAAYVAGFTAWQRPPAPVATAPASRLVARGEVRPVQHARIGTLLGGVVQDLRVEVGDSVGEQREVARVKALDGTIEVITAPWRGTVTGIPIHDGDTVLPGAAIMTIADLSRLRVESTDVDEFLIARIERGQEVTFTVDALDRQQFRGLVRSVSLELEKNDNGDDHYPVIVDILASTSGLRPGMSVRIDFGSAAG
jgi:multidrug efflux pump subunit AcrA (membrane-fusion protein)